MTPNPTVRCRERASVPTIPFSISVFLSSIDIRGVESLCVQLWDGGAKEKLGNRPPEGGCHHADLRIASGTVCVKAKKERERMQGGYIQQRERERESRREGVLKA